MTGHFSGRGTFEFDPEIEIVLGAPDQGNLERAPLQVARAAFGFRDHVLVRSGRNPRRAIFGGGADLEFEVVGDELQLRQIGRRRGGCCAGIGQAEPAV